MSELWRNLFNKLGVSLLFFTAYHLQTDEQSEATNQYLQTILWFFVNECQNDWAEHLEEVEFIINNLTNFFTKMSLNEILFGFKLWDTVTALGQQIIDNGVMTNQFISIRRAIVHAQAEDAACHASFHMTRNYNKKHKAMSFAIGNKVYIRFDHEYKL